MLFLVYEAEQRMKENRLVKLTRIIDWNLSGKKLEELGRSG